MRRYIIAILMISLSFLFSSCSSKGQTLTMHQLYADEVVGGERIILAKMSESEIQTAIKDYIKLCEDNDDHAEVPVITKSGDGFVLRYPDSTPYAGFCYWLNYIVYSNKERRYNDNVVGWFEVPVSAHGAWKPFAGQKLMFFIPSSDDEFDNVYFTTEDNVCYKQEFAFRALLKQQKKVFKKYIAHK